MAAGFSFARLPVAGGNSPADLRLISQTGFPHLVQRRIRRNDLLVELDFDQRNPAGL